MGGPIGGALGVLGGSVVDYMTGGAAPHPQGGSQSSTAPLVAPQQGPTAAAAVSQTPTITPTTPLSIPTIAPSIAPTPANTAPTAVPFDRRAAIKALQSTSPPRQVETPVATSNGWKFYYHKHEKSPARCRP